ncbi:MarR family transcriptional regulator [Microbacterium sp. BWT-B31]|uniref:MarR family winged helix-turn-helix transcriptional regulator n=1 Tax=Microbacterium sp. BWT-B31 TaxID=3232072 RepID=UPI00352763DC
MNRRQDLETIVISVHTLVRMAATETGSRTPQAQWRTLSLLNETGPLRLGELATLSRVTQPGMTRLVGQMAQAGLIDRSTDPDDSRAVVLAVTDAGRAELAQWRNELTRTLAPWFDDLDETEWQALHTAAAILDRKTRVTEAAL